MDVGGVMDDSQVSDLDNQVPFAESENSEENSFVREMAQAQLDLLLLQQL